MNYLEQETIFAYFVSKINYSKCNTRLTNWISLPVSEIFKASELRYYSSGNVNWKICDVTFQTCSFYD